SSVAECRNPSRWSAGRVSSRDQVMLIATPNSFERPVIARNGNSATSAGPGVAAISLVISTIPRTVVIAVVLAVAHTHATNRGINSHLCGRRYHRRGDCNTCSRQQTNQNRAHVPPLRKVVNDYVSSEKKFRPNSRNIVMSYPEWLASTLRIPRRYSAPVL